MAKLYLSSGQPTAARNRRHPNPGDLSRAARGRRKRHQDVESICPVLFEPIRSELDFQNAGRPHKRQPLLLAVERPRHGARFSLRLRRD